MKTPEGDLKLKFSSNQIPNYRTKYDDGDTKTSYEYVVYTPLDTVALKREEIEAFYPSQLSQKKRLRNRLLATFWTTYCRYTPKLLSRVVLTKIDPRFVAYSIM